MKKTPGFIPGIADASGKGAVRPYHSSVTTAQNTEFPSATVTMISLIGYTFPDAPRRAARRSSMDGSSSRGRGRPAVGVQSGPFRMHGCPLAPEGEQVKFLLYRPVSFC